MLQPSLLAYNAILARKVNNTSIQIHQRWLRSSRRRTSVGAAVGVDVGEGVGLHAQTVVVLCCRSTCAHYSASRSADPPQSRRGCGTVQAQSQRGLPVQMWTVRRGSMRGAMSMRTACSSIRKPHGTSHERRASIVLCVTRLHDDERGQNKSCNKTSETHGKSVLVGVVTSKVTSQLQLMRAYSDAPRM